VSNSLAAALVLLAQLNAPGNTPEPLPPEGEGITCQKTDDKISEMNRICFYRCGEDEVQVTQPLADLCPEEIQR
jgi:hypothetical protein